MSAQPEPISSLLPDVLPPQRGVVSGQKYKRRYIPKTYTPAEVDAAKRVIAHWNRTFANRRGAYRANPGDACHIKAFVRMLHRCEKSEGLFQFDEKQVCQAITAYRNDSNNVRLERWKRFTDWITPESVDFYVGQARVKEHRREQPKAARRVVDKVTAAAARIVKHNSLVHLAELASRINVTLRHALNECVGNNVEGAKESLAHLDRRESFTPADKDVLSNRARRVFKAYYHRPPGRDQHDPARLNGIELALLDLDARKGNHDA